MRKRLKVLIFVVTANFILFLLSSCARSTAYQREQGLLEDGARAEASSNRKTNAATRLNRFGQPKKRVYVLPFNNTTTLGGAALGNYISTELMVDLKQGPNAVVAEDVRGAMNSKEFFADGKMKLGALVREGKRMGVSVIALGKIKKIVYRTKGDDVGLFRKKQAVAAADVEMVLFDVTNAKQILTVERTADSSISQFNLLKEQSEDPAETRDELVKLALLNAARMLSSDAIRAFDKIAWEGRIAKIVGNDIFINAGRSSGINIGDILKVLTPGEDVYDPVTGTYMGKATGKPKGTIEIKDYFGPDGSVGVVHSGGSFSENDIVQLY